MTDKIIFNKNAFEEWIQMIGCDDCQYFPRLEGTDIVHRWESIIDGMIIKHREIELRGKMIDKLTPIEKVIAKDFLRSMMSYTSKKVSSILYKLYKMLEEGDDD